MGNRVAITFLRHGMTSDNERKAYLGWANPPLSEKGRLYVQQIYKNLKTIHVEAVFSSDLERCVQTANILFPKRNIQKVEELREMNFGEWDQKTYEELKSDLTYREWLTDPFTSGPVSGEMYDTFASRVKTGFEKVKQEIIEKNLANIVIVTHGGVIRHLLTELVDSSNGFFDWQVPYSEGYQLQWSIEAFRRGEKCTSLQEVPITGRQNG